MTRMQPRAGRSIDGARRAWARSTAARDVVDVESLPRHQVLTRDGRLWMVGGWPPRAKPAGSRKLPRQPQVGKQAVDRGQHGHADIGSRDTFFGGGSFSLYMVVEYTGLGKFSDYFDQGLKQIQSIHYFPFEMYLSEPPAARKHKSSFLTLSRPGYTLQITPPKNAA
ncbi:hypothetical protein C8R44DRAFT_753187 [Mycena epipterygia]|nr:hypothetical protein C8R44DRAFT_753187 [Mycena epipterygia]